MQQSRPAIENLMARYAELADEGDLAGLADLLADATFSAGDLTVSGRDPIEKALRDTLVIHPDGTPRTKHVVTNVAIEVDEAAGTAAARSYVTVLQALPDLPLQPILCGRYHDRYERHGGRWRFAERRIHVDLVGDVRRHLRRRR